MGRGSPGFVPRSQGLRPGFARRHLATAARNFLAKGEYAFSANGAFLGLESLGQRPRNWEPSKEQSAESAIH
jgi:hypothetical protein